MRSAGCVAAPCVAALVACGSPEEGSEVEPAPVESADPADLDVQTGQLTPTASAAAPGEPQSGASSVTGLVDAETDDESPACVAEFVALAQVPPVLQFVVDTSGSMNWVAGTERLPQAGEQSKWEITQAALATAIAAMPDAAAVGINYYPNTAGGGPICHVPVLAAPIAPLTPEQRELIARANASQVPAGGTPTHAAYEFGVEQLDSSSLEGSRFLVLITDGIPTFTLECGGNGSTRVDAAPLLASVDERYRTQNIRSFVIGSPGSELAREELSEMAWLGGTGAPGCSDVVPGTCHFDMTGQGDFSTALNQALGDIAEVALGCEYAVPEPPAGRARIDLDDVSVVIEAGGNPVGEFQRSASAECTSGWLYNVDRTRLVLCGSTCDELNQLVREDPTTAVRLEFGCATTPS